MSRNPRVTGADLIAALSRGGFQVVRIKGSHHFLRHEDGRSTVVPAHSGETVGPSYFTEFSETVNSLPNNLAGLCKKE